VDITYLIVGIVLLLVVFALYYTFFRVQEDFYNYKDDTLYGVHWRWSWKKDTIMNLQCFCPSCDSVLVYENDFILHKTYFLCPTCDEQKAVIGGGDSKYSFGIVKREIQRKIRTKEYKKLAS